MSTSFSPIRGNICARDFTGERPSHEQKNISEREEARLLIAMCREYSHLFASHFRSNLRYDGKLTKIEIKTERERNIELFMTSSPRILALTWNMLVSSITDENKSEVRSILNTYYWFLAMSLYRKKVKNLIEGEIPDYFASIIKEVRALEKLSPKRLVFPSAKKFGEFVPDCLKLVLFKVYEF